MELLPPIIPVPNASCCRSRSFCRATDVNRWWSTFLYLDIFSSANAVYFTFDWMMLFWASALLTLKMNKKCKKSSANVKKRCYCWCCIWKCCCTEVAYWNFHHILYTINSLTNYIDIISQCSNLTQILNIFWIWYYQVMSLSFIARGQKEDYNSNAELFDCFYDALSKFSESFTWPRFLSSWLKITYIGSTL